MTLEEIKKDIQNEIIMRRDLRDYCFDILKPQIELLCRKIDNIQKSKSESSICAERYIEFINRICKLEQEVRPDPFVIMNQYKDLCNKVEILNNRLSLFENSNNKKPYKCPVCDGYTGTVINGVVDEECNACEGKGIVWG